MQGTYIKIVSLLFIREILVPWWSFWLCAADNRMCNQYIMQCQVNTAYPTIKYIQILNWIPGAIIGTFHEKGAQTFWVCVLRLPLQDNRIVAWKFCYVLHKVLREGHPQVLPHSQRHRKAIEDLGKLWVSNKHIVLNLWKNLMECCPVSFSC